MGTGHSSISKKQGQLIAEEEDGDVSLKTLLRTSVDDKVWLGVTEENLFNESFTNEKYYLLHSRGYATGNIHQNHHHPQTNIFNSNNNNNNNTTNDPTVRSHINTTSNPQNNNNTHSNRSANQQSNSPQSSKGNVAKEDEESARYVFGTKSQYS